MSFSSSDTSCTDEEKLVPSEPIFEMVQVARCLGPSLVGANRVTLRDDEPAFTERTIPDIARNRLGVEEAGKLRHSQQRTEYGKLCYDYVFMFYGGSKLGPLSLDPLKLI